jgi:hypothetical protein
MSVENFNYIILPRAESHTSTSYTLTNVPIASPKRRGPAVERIPEHGARLNGPSAQEGKAAAKSAAIVELPIGQDGSGGFADGLVVIPGPAFLETDDVWRRVEEGQLAADLSESRGAKVGDDEEAPAVEGEEADLRDGGVAGALRG